VGKSGGVSMPNRVITSGYYDVSGRVVLCSQTDDVNNPFVSAHRPEIGVIQIVFNKALMPENVTMLVSSTGDIGVAGRTNDANAYVRNVDASGCTVVTAVWDGDKFVLANSNFHFTLIETPPFFGVGVTGI
jgi:hypothetical protein